ncbi:MAG TPA: UDP-glucose 4-epimerase GalE [Chloroflexia bacterium]|nr:UDP-glucose 4-epimerase GalE [Chloroflexia bacterium]
MQILVTGGAGYIGSHTVKLLRERGYAVVVLDSLERGHRAAVGDTPLVVGDIRDSALLDRLFGAQPIDAVIHFAAYKAPGESMAQPARYFDNNVAGTLTLLQAMQRAGVDRFVFSSSCAIYGTPAVLPVDETAPPHPENPYGESKLLVEQMLRWLAAGQGLRFVSLRYFNAAGAALDASIGEDWTVTANLIPLVIKAALGKRPPAPIYGTDYPTPDGTAIRDYIHVLDLADAHIRALEYLDRPAAAEFLNLGTGQGASVQEVVDMVRQVSGGDVPVVYTARRPGDPAAVWADNTRARAVLGWAPRYGLAEIVASAWRWHATHPEGYHPHALNPATRP